MKVSAKLKKALTSIRKELGFSPADIKTMLGDAISLTMIKDFETNNSSENDFLVVVYFNIFHFITSERLETVFTDVLVKDEYAQFLSSLQQKR